jgi:predicted CxxxxCH...CXXCH cytochrome family protein
VPRSRRAPLAAVAIAALAIGCSGSRAGDDPFGGQYHPDGFAEAEAHGPAMKLGGDDCRGCHGVELEGSATAPSCDGCHTPEAPTAWRTDCTFCHGGEADETGAPPGEIEGDGAVASFVAHTAHVNSQMMSTGFDCTQCHVKAVDVLSPGHIFEDLTPAAAEVDMGAGLSPQGSYDGDGCANLYCHGSGRADDGAIAKDAASLDCTGCHAGVDSAPAAQDAMSGLHRLHLAAGDGLTCATCHAGVSTDGLSLTDPARHLDGARDVAIAEANFTFAADAKLCTGSCHGVNHASWGWNGVGGSFHPAGFAAAEMHGPEMELQRSDCRACHGADLTGGSGQSCDNCHSGASPTAWRTDCTFCHGGGLNQTGAPPQDLGSANDTASQSFVAHTAHVTQGIAKASDCVDCHKKPTDVMSVGHAFDATPGKAELDFTGGRSPAATYDGNGGCGGLYCHGNGRTDTGVATDGMQGPTCSGCHPRSGMSSNHRGEHGQYGCEECHASVTTDGASILAPLLHIDKVRQVKFRLTTITWNPATRTCTGECHEGHSNERW